MQFPASPGEWRLTMKRSFLGIPLGPREFRVAGFDKVYYDTLGLPLQRRDRRSPD